MAASRTVADTLPAEFKRQALRIDEQLDCLTKILSAITDRLDDMSTMMETYSEDLATQFVRLSASLKSYQSKSQSIYKDMSQSLSDYATSLMHYLDELTQNVKELELSVNEL